VLKLRLNKKKPVPVLTVKRRKEKNKEAFRTPFFAVIGFHHSAPPHGIPNLMEE
jgi:hypothetical protein